MTIEGRLEWYKVRSGETLMALEIEGTMLQKNAVSLQNPEKARKQILPRISRRSTAPLSPWF